MRGERGGGLNRVGMPCRPLGGPAPAPFSSLSPVARATGGRGVYLQFIQTDIYF